MMIYFNVSLKPFVCITHLSHPSTGHDLGAQFLAKGPQRVWLPAKLVQFRLCDRGSGAGQATGSFSGPLTGCGGILAHAWSTSGSGPVPW